MPERKCENCLFGDKCPSPGVCEHYAPVDEEQDEYLDDYIESERKEFHTYMSRRSKEDVDFLIHPINIIK